MATVRGVAWIAVLLAASAAALAGAASQAKSLVLRGENASIVFSGRSGSNADAADRPGSNSTVVITAVAWRAMLAQLSLLADADAARAERVVQLKAALAGARAALAATNTTLTAEHTQLAAYTNASVGSAAAEAAAHSAILATGVGAVEAAWASLEGPEAALSSAVQQQQYVFRAVHEAFFVEVSAVSAGGTHTCAVMRTRAVVCWGDGAHGRLGYGSTANVGDTPSTLPSMAGTVSVGGDVRAINAGVAHTCVVLVSKAVVCWGRGVYGQLGYGSTANVGDTPSTLPSMAGTVSLEGEAQAVASGSQHTCALLVSQEVVCWGRSSFGQLGYGNTDDVGNTPSTLPSTAGPVSVGGDVIAITTGDFHTCALLVSKAVVCWGQGSHGKLGYGRTDNVGATPSTLPSIVGNVSVGGDVQAIDASTQHTCALLVSQEVVCWGWGAYGRLGYGSTANVGDDELPSTSGSVSVGGDVQAIATGLFHTCALLTTGAVVCWGNAGAGRLGYGGTTDVGDTPSTLPSMAGTVSVGGDVQAISVGLEHTCALTASKAVVCWGQGQGGRLGYGSEATVGYTPSTLPSMAGSVSVGS